MFIYFNFEDKAIELLKDVINIGMKKEEDYSISTGGLKANFFMTGTISLEFILEDFRIYGNEYLKIH